MRLLLAGPRCSRSPTSASEALRSGARERCRTSGSIRSSPTYPRVPAGGCAPYPRQRWPLGLEREMRLVTWDRATTMTRVSRDSAPNPRSKADERRAARARERIAKVEAARPELIELATLLSPAATIEPELLRRVRLDVLPHFGADVEADPGSAPSSSRAAPTASRWQARYRVFLVAGFGRGGLERRGGKQSSSSRE